MNLLEIHQQLLKMANQVEKCFVEVCLPKDTTNLADAFTRLRAARGGKYFQIHLRLDLHSTDETPSVRWEVYNGDTTFEAGTLGEALDKALATELPQKQDTLDNCQDVIQGATVAHL